MVATPLTRTFQEMTLTILITLLQPAPAASQSVPVQQHRLKHGYTSTAKRLPLQGQRTSTSAPDPYLPPLLLSQPPHCLRMMTPPSGLNVKRVSLIDSSTPLPTGNWSALTYPRRHQLKNKKTLTGMTRVQVSTSSKEGHACQTLGSAPLRSIQYHTQFEFVNTKEYHYRIGRRSLQGTYPTMSTRMIRRHSSSQSMRGTGPEY